MRSYAQLKEIIQSRLPNVTTAHSDKGHFYVHTDHAPSDPYPSVTGKLQAMKDEGIMNYKMNRALDFVFGNFKTFTDDNILENLEKAKQVPVEIFEDAGDLGTEVHDARQQYFWDWIKTGVRPAGGMKSYLPEMAMTDARITSCCRAIESFLDKEGYIPLACEIFLVDDKNKIGGTMDDVGLLPRQIRPGMGKCNHETTIQSLEKLTVNCLDCNAKWTYDLVFMDLKTSNQVKFHYVFQLAFYYQMFLRWIKLRPKRNFILKVSKLDGTYKITWLDNLSKFVPYTKYLLKVDEGIQKAKEMIKPPKLML